MTAEELVKSLASVDLDSPDLDAVETLDWYVEQARAMLGKAELPKTSDKR